MNTNLVTIVTGGSRGVGRAVALKMAKHTNVMVVGRTQKDLLSVCAAIEKAGGKADYCVGDVSWPATAKEAVRKCAANGWTVQNLICNAGIVVAGTGDSAGSDRHAWQHMFNVNMHGSLYFMQACMPQMIEQSAGNICILSRAPGGRGKSRNYGIMNMPICPDEGSRLLADLNSSPKRVFPCYAVADAVELVCSSERA